MAEELDRLNAGVEYLMFCVIKCAVLVLALHFLCTTHLLVNTLESSVSSAQILHICIMYLEPTRCVQRSRRLRRDNHCNL
jgi:hypothetical protein